MFRRPVSELNISTREFYHWLAYLKLHPPGEDEEVRTAALMAQITNMSGKTLPKGKHVSAADFMQKPKPKAQSRADQIAFMKGIKGA